MNPSNHERGGRVLLVTEIRFWRRDTGAAQRIAALCDAILAAGFALQVYFPDRVSGAERMALNTQCPGLRLATPALPGLVMRAIKRRAGGLLGRQGMGPASLPEPLRRPWITERQAACRRACVSFQPQVVLVEYLLSSYLVEGLKSAMPKLLRVVDTIDVLSERERRFREGGGPAMLSITPEQEAEALGHFDVLLAIQDEEAAELHAMCPAKRVLTVGHGHLIDPQPVRGGFTSPTVLFFGSGAEHNLHALRFLLDEIWPLLRDRCPEAALLLAGGICERISGQLPSGVQALGRMEQPRDAYARADVVINPALLGSGLKIKNVEALCHGVPLVTTSAAAEGMMDGAGSAFHVGDDAGALASAAAHLLTNEPARRELAAGALLYARKRLSPEAAAAPLLDLLREACYRPES